MSDPLHGTEWEGWRARIEPIPGCRPVFDQDGVTLYHGDAPQVLRWLLGHRPKGRIVAVTDPPWPDVSLVAVDPWVIWAKTAPLLAELADRLLVWLGVSSDPRFLGAIPYSHRYFRCVRMRYPVASRSGKLLNDGDRVFVFLRDDRPSRRGGTGPAASFADLGPGVLPGSFMDGSRAKEVGHPCPRRLRHAIKLIGAYTAPDDVILDPFAGSGTNVAGGAGAGAARHRGRA